MSAAAAVAALLVITGAALVHVPRSAASGTGSVSILVLGDSYSAGNGAGGYDGPKGCWRSRNNYAHAFASAVTPPATVTNDACSGATTAAFFHAQSGRVHPQRDAVNASYGLIFLTIGGDDIHFAGIVQNCLIQISRDGRKCNDLLNAAAKELDDGSVLLSIGVVLDELHRRVSANARIVLLGYPYIEGQENYRLPYGRGQSVDVPARLKALGDLGDRVQQNAVDQLNARYHTHAFVFVNTKKLFAGHELFALRLNPNRWFIAPSTDATPLLRAVWYHPNPTGWFEEGRYLASELAQTPGSEITLRCSRFRPYNSLVSFWNITVRGVSCAEVRAVMLHHLHGIADGWTCTQGDPPWSNDTVCRRGRQFVSFRYGGGDG